MLFVLLSVYTSLFSDRFAQKANNVGLAWAQPSRSVFI